VAKKDKKAKKDRERERRREDAPLALAEPLVGPAGPHWYGDPVSEGGRTVVAVARAGDGVAVPVGYIELDADGSRFRPIAGPQRRERLVGGLGALAGALLGALIGLAVGRRGR